MTDQTWLAEQFEAHRTHLRSVAYRMLGSAPEAEDAVQEAWLRVSAADTTHVANLGGWLTTIVARICLDTLRSRESRREDSFDDAPAASASSPPGGPVAAMDPEQEAILAESVGLAVLVMLDKLSPAERVAFVLHDMFDVPFDDIASMLGRSPVATRQLASRARRRVSLGGLGDQPVAGWDAVEQRTAVEAFLEALRAGDLEGLLAVLDPGLVVSADATLSKTGQPSEIRGAATWARQAIEFRRAMESLQPALLDGAIGLVFAPGGTPRRMLRFHFGAAGVARIEIVADPGVLEKTNIEILVGR